MYTYFAKNYLWQYFRHNIILKTSNFIASSIQILQKLEDQVEYFRGDSFLIAADKKKEKNTRRLQNAERDFNASDEPRRTPGQKLG